MGIAAQLGGEHAAAQQVPNSPSPHHGLLYLPVVPQHCLLRALGCQVAAASDSLQVAAAQ